MKWERLHELWPGSDVLENLEFLQAEALALRAKLTAPLAKGSLGAFMAQGEPAIEEFEKYNLLKKFREFLEQKEAVLGANRVTRILFTNLPNTIGPNVVLDISPTEIPERWASGVLINIEHEMDVIDKRRTMWMTGLSAFCAAVAALLGVAALIVGVISLFRMQ